MSLHLSTKTCCDYEFTAKDIIPPLMSQKQAVSSQERHLYGGTVTRFSNAKCPVCETEYVLWLKPVRGSYGVVTISKQREQEDINTMDKQALQAYIKSHNGQYDARWGEEKLREYALGL